MSAFTLADSLSAYRAGLQSATYPDDLGGVRSALEVELLSIIPGNTNTLPQLILRKAFGKNGEGTAYLRATSSTAIKYVSPAATEGTGTSLANNAQEIISTTIDAAKAIRLARDRADVFKLYTKGQGLSLDYKKIYNNVIGQANISNAERVSGDSTYSSFFLRNHSALTASSVFLYLSTLGTDSNSSVAQLPGAGAGTIQIYYTGTSPLLSWPDTGYCLIKTVGGSIREIVYYSAKTINTLTVPAAGRGLLGTAAAGGAADDTIHSIPGVRIGVETPASDGSIQRIASNKTAPTGITWYSGTTSATGVSVGSLTAGAQVGVWIHRQIPAGAVYQSKVENRLTLDYTVSAVSYTETLFGLYRIEDTTIELYKLYRGTNADPDPEVDSPVATSATLPFNYVIPLPGAETEYRFVVRKTNRYGLSSLNYYTRNVTITPTGADTSSIITSPSDVDIEEDISGYVHISAAYVGSLDASPADQWALYITTNGVNPNPSVDTPTIINMDDSAGGLTTASFKVFGTGTKYLNSFQGAYAYATDFRIILRARRLSDLEEDTNLDVTQITISNTEIALPLNRFLSHGDQQGQSQNDALSETYYVHQGDNIRFEMLEGESQFWIGSTLVWRCVFSDTSRAEIHIPNTWDIIEDDTSWGAGTATAYGVERVSATQVYIIVDSVRRVKIDSSALQISAAEFFFDTMTMNGAPTNAPVFGSLHLMIFDPTFNRFRVFASVDTAGQLKTTYDVIQQVG